MPGVNVRTWGLEPSGFAWFRPVTRYIVLRPAPDLPPGFMPPRDDGLWIDRPTQVSYSVHPGTAQAVPTGRCERREDGVLAEVYEVRPAPPATGEAGQ